MRKKQFFQHRLDIESVKRVFWLSLFYIDEFRSGPGGIGEQHPDDIRLQAHQHFESVRKEADRIQRHVEKIQSSQIEATEKELVSLVRTFVIYFQVMQTTRRLQCIAGFALGWSEWKIIRECQPIYPFPEWCKKFARI